MSNLFLNTVSQKDTRTENGALSNSTTGNAALDYFSKAGTYRGRDEKAVFADISRVWGENKLMALQIIFFLRIVTRKLKGLFETTTVQKGMGVRDEFRKAVKWLALYQPVVMERNMWLIPVVGTWKDLWHPDLIAHLDQQDVFELIRKGLADPYNRGLIAKYLPRIRSKSNTKNDRHKQTNRWAKNLCDYLSWTPREYNKFKSHPENVAHLWQRHMSAGLWDNIDFNAIPGKALFQLTTHRGKDKKTVLERRGLEKKYEQWIAKQPVAKFTGYPYELLMATSGKVLSRVEKMTIDKQFDGLIELAKKDAGGLKGNVWCALDTSGSMTQPQLNGKGPTPIQVCMSLGIYFSALNEGAFKDHVIMFDSTSRVKKLSGTFTDKVGQIPANAMGGTNFQSVIDEIVRVRRSNPTIPISEFPDTLLVVSDMQFNPSDGYGAQRSEKTNYEMARAKLAGVGLPDMKIIWWWVTGRKQDFPSVQDDAGVVMVGGFDGSIITTILGGETTKTDEITGKVRQLTPYENMEKALNQEVLLQVKVE